MRDQVGGLDAGAEGRRVLDRRDHLDQAVLAHGHLDSQAAELAAGLHLHFPEILGVEVARMGVHGRQHAGDGGFDQILIGRFLHVIRADPFEDVAEEVEKPVRVGVVRFRVGRLGQRRQQQAHRHGHQEQSMLHPLTLPLRAASHGRGLMGWPSRRNST